MRQRFAFWQRWLRRLVFRSDRRLLDCVACRANEATGPDFLCDSCYGDPDIREDYLDD